MASGKPSKNIPKRASNPKRAARRARSLQRCEARKKLLREHHEANRKRNIQLRREGLPTPQEVRRAAHREARETLRESGQLIEKPRNERGFILMPDGTLRDPGDWHKRRKVRYEEIKNGFITVLGNPEKGFTGNDKRRR